MSGGATRHRRRSQACGARIFLVAAYGMLLGAVSGLPSTVPIAVTYGVVDYLPRRRPLGRTNPPVPVIPQ